MPTFNEIDTSLPFEPKHKQCTNISEFKLTDTNTLKILYLNARSIFQTKLMNSHFL